MNQTSIPSRRPRRRRAPLLVAATATALGAGLAAPAVLNAASATYPANQTFDATATPWQSSGSCEILDLGGLLDSLAATGPAAVPAGAQRLSPALLGDILGLLDPGDPQEGLLRNLLGDLLAGAPLAPEAVQLLTQTVQGLTGADIAEIIDGGVLQVDALVARLLATANGSVDVVRGLLAGVFCEVRNGHTPADGNPAGALRTEVTGLLQQTVNIGELLGRGRATWTSAQFTHTHAPPTAAEFTFDVRTSLSSLIAVGEGFSVSATLRRADGSVIPVGTWKLTDEQREWTTLTTALPASAITQGGRYAIVLDIETTGTLNLLQLEEALHIDNVRLTTTFPDGTDGPEGGNGAGGGVEGVMTGAGGLGACTTSIVRPAPQVVGAPRGTFTLSRRQLVINQRISSAGVTRVNQVLDTLQAGLTGADFQDCTVGADRFAPSLLRAIADGTPAGPATSARGPRATPVRLAGPNRTDAITLSRAQLLINQRISSAAVRRVNAITARLNGGLTAGDLRRGSLQAITLDSSARSAFASALPAAGELPDGFVPLDIRAKKREDRAGIRLTKQQLVINQRISAAAVRRINAVNAQLAVGLTGENIAPGALSRATLAPSIQLGR